MRRIAAWMVCLAALAGCETPVTSSAPQSVARPVTRQPVRPTPPPPSVPAEPAISEASRALAAYYARLQTDLIDQGRLRGDGGGPDTPFTDRMLADNFLAVAMFDEYVTENGILRAQPTQARLRRWDQPVRMTVEFGASVPAAQRARDRSTVASYAARLAKATGQSISMSDTDPNFHVLFLSEDERATSGDRLRQIVPGIDSSSLRAISLLPRDQLCIVIAFSRANSASYAKAVAVIRAEHPDLLRTSCIHEELAQGLGLANDSPLARPSIFNDDDEFAFLTTHDEMLLKLLYDPRVKAGMDADEVRPIVAARAAELLGGSS